MSLKNKIAMNIDKVTSAQMFIQEIGMSIVYIKKTFWYN